MQAVGIGAFEPKQHDTATRGNKNRKENSLDCLLRNHYVNGPFYQTSHNNFAKLAVPVSEKKQTQEDVVTALQSTKLGLGLQLPYLGTRPWKFRKPSMQWAAGHLLASPSGGPWLARQTAYKRCFLSKNKHELLGPSRGFLVLQCLHKHIFTP